VVLLSREEILMRVDPFIAELVVEGALILGFFIAAVWLLLQDKE